MRVMYMSALKEHLLADDPTLLTFVLPNLCAFRAIKQALEVTKVKNLGTKKEVEKSSKRVGTASLDVTVLKEGFS